MVLKRRSLPLIGIFLLTLSSWPGPLDVQAFSPSSSLTSTSWQQGIQYHHRNNNHALVNRFRNNHAISRQPTSRRRWESSEVPSFSRTQTTTTSLTAIMDIVGTSPEPIHTAFAFATFGPQPFWLLLIFLPKQAITRKIMGKLDIVLFFALVHFFIVSASVVQPGSTAPLLEFNDVFDPSKDSQAAFMNMVTNYPNFVAEEWSHVLTWDLFVGRWIWLDGLERGVFTSHSVLFSNLIGPPGLLIHWVTCLVSGKGLSDNEAPEIDDGI